MQLSPFLRCFPYHRSPLQGNPRWPRSGGQLDAIDFVTIAIPSLRSLRSRHNLRHFSYYATSLCAPAPQQHGAVACTLRQVLRSIRSPPCGSNSVFEIAHTVYKCPLNEWTSKRPLHKLAVGGFITSLNKHIPLISPLQIGFCSGVGVPPAIINY